MKKLTANYIYNLIYQIMLVVIPFITIPYISRVLLPEGVGLYSYSNSITQYFSLFGCLGINLYGQREIARRSNNRYEQCKCFYELVIIRLISASICLSIYLFFSVYIVNELQLRNLLIIQMIVILSDMIDISWFYQGLENFRITALRSIIIKILTVALIFSLVHTETDLYKYTAIMSLSVFAGNLILWCRLKSNVVRIPVKSLEIKKHIKPILILFLPQISSSVHTVLDKSMIGFLSVNDEVAYYQQAQKIINLLLVFTTSLNTVLMPRMSCLAVEKNYKRIREFLDLAINYVFLLGIPIVVGLCVESSDFVPIFFGNEYYRVIPILMSMSILVIIIGLSNTFGIQFMVPMGMQNRFTTSILLGTCVNVILNVFLISKFGAIGATIGTIVSELVITIYQYVCVKRTVSGLRLRKLIFYYGAIGLFLLFLSEFAGKYIDSLVLRVSVRFICIIIAYGFILYMFKNKYFIAIISKSEKIIKSVFVRKGVKDE